MGFLHDAYPWVMGGLLAAAIALTWIATRKLHQAERPGRLEQELRPARLYTMRALVDQRALHRHPPIDLESIFAELELKDLDLPGGPDTEIRWAQLATSADQATRIARRRLERLGMPPSELHADEARLA